MKERIARGICGTPGQREEDVDWTRPELSLRKGRLTRDRGRENIVTIVGTGNSGNRWPIEGLVAGGMEAR